MRRRRLRLYEAIDSLQDRPAYFTCSEYLTITQTLILALHNELPKCRYVTAHGLTKGRCGGSYLKIGSRFLSNPSLVGVICDELPRFYSESDIYFSTSDHKSDKR